MIPARIDSLRPIIEEAGLEALLVTKPENRFYMSGFSGTSGLLVLSRSETLLFTDFRYLEQAEKEAPQYEVIRYKENLFDEVAGFLGKKGWLKIGFEGHDLAWQNYDRLQSKLKKKLTVLNEGVEKLRRVKSDDELGIIRRGAEKLDLAFKWLQETIRPGMVERDLAVELEIYLLRQGAVRPSFNFIVASGERGALPHGVASGKAMQRGELVTVDYGAVFENYATDITRNFMLGIPDDRHKEIYEIVAHAQSVAVDAVKPGLKGQEIDQVARDIIKEAGYGEYFGHGLGHGIGLETHEQPALTPKNEIILEPGMVITIEPGIYLPDWGGVRIEDMVLVTDRGAERLTRSSRELVII